MRRTFDDGTDLDDRAFRNGWESVIPQRRLSTSSHQRIVFPLLSITSSPYSFFQLICNLYLKMSDIGDEGIPVSSSVYGWDEETLTRNLGQRSWNI